MPGYANILLFVSLIFSAQLHAAEYLYHAEVKGMVCAFCAYSVSKNISKIPGVDADSVNVDLKAGDVRFSSSLPVDQAKLSTLFNDSGFTISQLKLSEVENAMHNKPDSVEMRLEIDSNKIGKYLKMLESLGDLAASHASRLIIEAPLRDEDLLLKPILMGRQQVVNVRFSSSESDKIVLQLISDE